MDLYADEDFDFGVVKELRLLGHDVLTVHEEDGMQATRILAFLAVLTHNRGHFERLHKQGLPHSGIVAAKQSPGKQVGWPVTSRRR
jgi:hypothetical protein